MVSLNYGMVSLDKVGGWILNDLTGDLLTLDDTTEDSDDRQADPRILELYK